MPTVAPVPVLPVQPQGIKPSRALPYALHASAEVVPADQPRRGDVRLTFANIGTQAAVFHVYDRNNLAAIPRRYTVEAGRTLADTGRRRRAARTTCGCSRPNGFHRHFAGNARRAASAGQPNPEVLLGYEPASGQLRVQLGNLGPVAATFALVANAYFPATPTTAVVVARGTARSCCRWAPAAAGTTSACA